MKKLLFFVSLGFLLFFGVVNSVQYVHAYIDGEYNVNITTVINGAEDSITTLENQKYGSLITPFTSTDAPEGHEFSFWIVNGVVRKDLISEYEFAVTANLEITGIFEPLDGTAHAVIFIDSNGKLIQTSFVLNNQTVTTLPSIEGFSKPQYVVSTTPWKEANGNAAVFTNITESKVFVLQYELAGDVEPVTITVNGTPQEYAYNEVVTVTADLEGFTHWEENGVVVSYDESYTFTALTNRELLAKNDGSFPQPLVTLSNVSGIRAGYKSFLGQVYLPSGFEIVELGLIASSEEKVLLLDDVNATVIPSNTIQANTKEFLRSFDESSFTTFRAYAVLRNGENVVVEYSDNNYYSVPEVVGKKYTETFADFPLDSSTYKSGESIGVGVQKWFYSGANGSQLNAITLGGSTADNSYLKTTFEKGLTAISFTHTKPFSSTQEYGLYLNNVLKGQFTPGTSSPFILNLNYQGKVELEIKPISATTTRRQASISDLSWTESNQEAINTRLYGVEFIDNDTSTLKSVREGKFVQEPVEPSKDGYTFNGWFKNESESEPYNFDTPIYEHLILHAKFTEMSDSEKLEVAKNEVEIGYNGSDTSTNVTDNVTLPISGLYGTIISWSSSDTNVISIEGDVTQQETDVEVTLTATISLNEFQAIKTFTLTVKSINPDPIEHIVVYTFTSKSWEATSSTDGGLAAPGNWTSTNSGYGFAQNQGIQVTTGSSGANGTSPVINNIKSIEIVYCTNASKGAGNIVTKIGDNKVQDFTVTKTGGTTIRSAGVATVANLSGAINISVNCTTNSIYIHSIKITYLE